MKYNDIVNKIINNASFYEISLEDIAKRFLNEFLNFNVFDYKESFEKILNFYQLYFNDFESPTEKNKFYRYIAKKYLKLIHAPKDELFSLYSVVNKNLQQIQEYIQKLDKDIKKIEKIKNENGYLEVEDRYRRNHINYYLEKNKEAKNNILEFLSNDIKIKAYNNSLQENNFVGLGFGNFDFKYHRLISNIEQYDINNFTDIDNKMRELPVSVSIEIRKELYKADESKILDYLKAYMEFPDINMVNNIKVFIEKNHFLNKRKEVLLQIFKHLDNHDYISINNMLPLQIEGLFHDYCILLGIKEKELNISALNKKLDRIKEKNSNSMFAYINYEYFSFRFPIIRNRIAHGRHFNTNNEYQAISLIHDLYSVCQMIIDKDIELNIYLELINKININNSEFKHRLQLLNYIKIELPVFYTKEIKI